MSKDIGGEKGCVEDVLLTAPYVEFAGGMWQMRREHFRDWVIDFAGTMATYEPDFRTLDHEFHLYLRYVRELTVPLARPEKLVNVSPFGPERGFKRTSTGTVVHDLIPFPWALCVNVDLSFFRLSPSSLN